MKKLLLFTAVGVFTFGTLAATEFETVKTTPSHETTAVKAAAFPVYCDGEYAGDADTVQEAWDMC
jgi:hypothetical protein